MERPAACSVKPVAVLRRQIHKNGLAKLPNIQLVPSIRIPQATAVLPKSAEAREVGG
jgi:hypothetical protein